MTRVERLLLTLAFVAGIWVLGAATRSDAIPNMEQVAYSSPTLSASLNDDPDFAQAKRATMRLEHDDGVCSATAIEDSDPVRGSHLVLTAAHCVEISLLGEIGIHAVDANKLKTLRLGTRHAKVLKVEFDGNDGAILTTDIYFSDAATFGPKPKQGDLVFSHGNPAGVPDILVVGRVAGYVDNYFDVHDTMIVDFNCWYGCSGAAVFDRDGHIVGIVNAIFPWPQKGWRMTAVYPLTFTPAQYASL